MLTDLWNKTKKFLKIFLKVVASLSMVVVACFLFLLFPEKDKIIKSFGNLTLQSELEKQEEQEMRDKLQKLQKKEEEREEESEEEEKMIAKTIQYEFGPRVIRSYSSPGNIGGIRVGQWLSLEPFGGIGSVPLKGTSGREVILGTAELPPPIALDYSRQRWEHPDPLYLGHPELINLQRVTNRIWVVVNVQLPE